MHYVSSTSYISHDVDALRSTAVAGDFFTSGDLFPSQNLRGVKLATSTDMRSNAQRTYAPVISGVAKSNATVIIKQNDLVIATRKVTPGPFALKIFLPRQMQVIWKLQLLRQMVKINTSSSHTIP